MFFSTLKLADILSFRWVTPVELNQLNVLIGPNGAGKSNLVECIALLQALPNSLSTFLAKNGGSDSWIRNKPEKAKGGLIECDFQAGEYKLQYKLAFSAMNNSLQIQMERSNSCA